MKKILLGILAFSLLLGACKKDDTVNPEDKPDAKLIKVLDDYKSQLTGAEFGWKAYLMPDGGGVYSFLFKFDENERVQMLSDIDPSFEDAAFESSYRLKAIQRPSLFFDTYSYIHLLADPDIRYNGLYGTGQYSDFEFSFESSVADTIVLDGNYNHSRMILVRSKSQEESDNFMQNIKNVVGDFSRLKTYFKRVTLGSVEYEVTVNPASKSIIIGYLEGGELKTHSSNFYVDGNSMVLVTPLNNGQTTITSISDISLDIASGVINARIAGNSSQIRESDKPLKVDLQAARRFFNSPPNGVYWETREGFTVEGVRDAYRLNTIANFDGLTYYKAQPTYQGFLFWTTTGGYYGPAIITSFTDNGLIKFTHYGVFANPPAQAAPMVNQTYNQFRIPEGFYVIQTSESSYDLVSAKDARAWISFN